MPLVLTPTPGRAHQRGARLAIAHRGRAASLAAEAFGIREKLTTYCLDPTHVVGGAKAKGFAFALGITLETVDHLTAQIAAGILRAPIGAVRDNPPYGVNCVVDVPIQGTGAHRQRVVSVRTVWQLAKPGCAPRLVSAYIND